MSNKLKMTTSQQLLGTANSTSNHSSSRLNGNLTHHPVVHLGPTTRKIRVVSTPPLPALKVWIPVPESSTVADLYHAVGQLLNRFDFDLELMGFTLLLPSSTDILDSVNDIIEVKARQLSPSLEDAIVMPTQGSTSNEFLHTPSVIQSSHSRKRLRSHSSSRASSRSRSSTSSSSESEYVSNYGTGERSTSSSSSSSSSSSLSSSSSSSTSSQASSSGTSSSSSSSSAPLPNTKEAFSKSPLFTITSTMTRNGLGSSSKEGISSSSLLLPRLLVPPGSGLKRTQSRNARRRLLRRAKRERGTEEENEEEEEVEVVLMMRGMGGAHSHSTTTHKKEKEKENINLAPPSKNQRVSSPAASNTFGIGVPSIKKVVANSTPTMDTQIGMNNQMPVLHSVSGVGSALGASAGVEKGTSEMNLGSTSLPSHGPSSGSTEMTHDSIQPHDLSFDMLHYAVGNKNKKKRIRLDRMVGKGGRVGSSPWHKKFDSLVDTLATLPIPTSTPVPTPTPTKITNPTASISIPTNSTISRIQAKRTTQTSHNFDHDTADRSDVLSRTQQHSLQNPNNPREHYPNPLDRTMENPRFYSPSTRKDLPPNFIVSKVNVEQSDWIPGATNIVPETSSEWESFNVIGKGIPAPRRKSDSSNVNFGVIVHGQDRRRGDDDYDTLVEGDEFFSRNRSGYVVGSTESVTCLTCKKQAAVETLWETLPVLDRLNAKTGLFVASKVLELDSHTLSPTLAIKFGSLVLSDVQHGESLTSLVTDRTTTTVSTTATFRIKLEPHYGVFDPNCPFNRIAYQQTATSTPHRRYIHYGEEGEYEEGEGEEGELEEEWYDEDEGEMNDWSFSQQRPKLRFGEPVVLLSSEGSDSEQADDDDEGGVVTHPSAEFAGPGLSKLKVKPYSSSSSSRLSLVGTAEEDSDLYYTGEWDRDVLRVIGVGEEV